MEIISLLFSQELAVSVFTLFFKVFMVTLLGVVIIKLISGKSAPVRSLVSMGIIAVTGLAIVISIGFKVYGIAWYKPVVPVFLDPSAAFTETLLDEQNESLTVESSESVIPEQSGDTGSMTHSFFEQNKSTESAAMTRIMIIALINLICLIWLAGIVIQLFRFGFNFLLIIKFKRSLSAITDRSFIEMSNSAAVSFGKKSPPKLFTSHRIESPVTIGLLNPIVIIPQKLFDCLNENELKSILLHELAHIYNYDHIIDLINRVIIAVNWWNPLIYIINKEHEQAREEVSDNYVLRELNPKTYIQCITDLAEKVTLICSLPTASGMAGQGSSLSKRVSKILSKKRNTAVNTGLAFKAAAFSISLFFTVGIAGLHGQNSTEASFSNIMERSREISQRMDFEREGRNLTPEKAAELEECIKNNPDDIRSRSLLLLYYAGKRDELNKTKRKQMNLWLVENHPEADVLNRSYGNCPDPEIAEAWKAQVKKNPDNPHVLLNAGNNFTGKNIDLAIECYEHGKEIDSNNSEWDRRLGEIYKFKMIQSTGKERELAAQKSLSAYENVYNKIGSKSFPGIAKMNILPDMGKAAVEAGELDKAADYANQMLAYASKPAGNFYSDDGLSVYYGNFVLGMVAVKKDDIKSACEYLLKAGETKGSPTLVSFGPNLNLAKELLEHGERDTVAAFLKQCREFWTSGRDKCDIWIKEIEEGKTPDFRTQMYY